MMIGEEEEEKNINGNDDYYSLRCVEPEEDDS